MVQYKGDEGKGAEKERNSAGVKVMSGFKITQQVVVQVGLVANRVRGQHWTLMGRKVRLMLAKEEVM